MKMQLASYQDVDGDLFSTNHYTSGYVLYKLEISTFWFSI
jgi:hypothetical protein